MLFIISKRAIKEVAIALFTVGSIILINRNERTSFCSDRHIRTGIWLDLW